MQKIELDNLTDDQALVASIFINEGKLQAFEELIEAFEEEYFRTATEDPYYGYYVKYIIDTLKEKVSKLTNDEQA